ncbi:hypothetical protein F4806DRAFT_484940 [Annulohypoxylon nitens]|nr:hypothetical protein F4806DRAFT_484940 [Annulohypoxylon nitens]
MTGLDRVTLAVDVELRPSMYGELFWSYLCQLLSRDPRSPSAGIPVIDILMLSPYTCDRTVRTVEQFCPPVQMIEVLDLAPFPAERIKVDWNLENDIAYAAELFCSEDDGAVVVIVGRNPRKVRDLATAEITRASAFGLLELPPSRVYWVDPEADLTLALPRIDVLLISCVCESSVFDKGTSQVLVRQRYLDQNEVNRALSWALKTQRPDRVPVVVNIRPSELDRRDELIGAAWNSDMSWLLLELLALSPDVPLADLPTRVLPDPPAVMETLFRMYLMWMLSRPTAVANAFNLSAQGSVAAAVMRAARDSDTFPCEMDVHAARIAANVVEEKDVNVQRVLLRMAVISCVGLSAFRLASGARPGPADLKNQYAGPGRLRSERGGLWTSLGVYHDCFFSGRVGDDG